MRYIWGRSITDAPSFSRGWLVLCVRVGIAVFNPLDPWLYELCFPSAVSGEAEVSCPACGALLTVAVDDPIGSQTYCCSGCKTAFVV
jgi:hypothetical protein